MALFSTEYLVPFVSNISRYYQIPNACIFVAAQAGLGYRFSRDMAQVRTQDI